jgi:hypothetical protein|tara:strand:- start:413 stop:1027 length:615 start_codon:yes stop_codon:yes gene_type:complete
VELSAFIVSLVAVIIATTSTLISYLLFRDAKDPHVVVYADPDLKRPSIINLIIENTGRSAAWNVSFQSTKPVPQEAFGIENARKPASMNRGPIVNGIPCLGPGSRRVITWGQFDGIRQGIDGDYLDITSTYQSEPSLAFWKRAHQTVSRIDIQSFENFNVSDRNWDKKIAEQLEVIASEVKRLRAKPENALRVMPIERQSHEPE